MKGDDSNSGWTLLYGGGVPIVVSHTWDEQGTYYVKAMSRDIYGFESDWTTLEVSMPKNKGIITPFLNFLENHPNMFPLLRQLLDL